MPRPRSTPVAALGAVVLLLALAVPAGAQTPPPAAAPAAPAVADADPVLAENSVVKVRKSDYDLELLRLDADARAGFSNSRRRIEDLVLKILMTKTLAVQAHEQKLDQDPEVAQRFRSEAEHFWSGARVAMLERAAAAEFDATRDRMEARAKELYLANKAKFTVPEQVSASHILFSIEKHSGEDAKRLAAETRAKIVAGADFNQTAVQVSEDPSAYRNEGRLGQFGRGTFDPDFTEAAYRLQKVGDVSEPVKSRFGWHLIRLDGRVPARVPPYEEVREAIFAQMKGRFVDERRDAVLDAIRTDPAARVETSALDAIYAAPPDTATIRRMTEEALRKNAPKPN